MITRQETVVNRLLILTSVLLLGLSLAARAQILEASNLTNNPLAMFIITNLLAEPQPELSVPLFSRTNTGPEANYWRFQGPPLPLPLDPFPELLVYQIGTNQYLIDDRSVNYPALNALLEAEAEAEGWTNPPATISLMNTNGLWINVPTNSLAVPDYFSVNLMNTLQGQDYDILTSASLPATWATELTVTGAVGNVTPVQVPMNNSTNLFVLARTSVDYSFYLITEPLSQAVCDGDTVTFSVATGGNTNLSFQWTFNGVAIPGATNSTYTINGYLDPAQGSYACIISDRTNSLITAAAQLTAGWFGNDLGLIYLLGNRQDYTFKSGVTYYIGGPIQLYGNTTIEAGAVLKFDFDNSTNSSLIIMGGLTCKTTPYNPAILTSMDDDSAGEYINGSTSAPQTVTGGVPYLDMTSATSSGIGNLRFLFADWGVTTPVLSGSLDVWDCQFVQCNYGVVNLVARTGASDNLHNVLFSQCAAAVAASTNAINIGAEQVTAQVNTFCLAASTPDAIALTNSLIWGSSVAASHVLTNNVVFNPDPTNFVSVGEGNFYLAPTSPLHSAGTANISERLQTECQGKTTYPPLAIADGVQISGQITLSPQVPRYTSGAPDLGYYYDTLDYTVGALGVAGGSVTVLPGTAIGIRNDYLSASGYWTCWGFYVNQGGSIISHGTPTRPNIFASADLVQETPNTDYADYWVGYSEYAGDWLPRIISFITDCEPGDAASPTLDFRFSAFYVPAAGLHLCSGLSSDGYFLFSASSSVNLNLQDCSLHNGQVNLGQPDACDACDWPQTQVFGSGAITWINSLFENVSINLDPTYYAQYGCMNVDLAFSAYNNLFRGGQWFHLAPIPASAGSWTLTDNLFDQVNFVQGMATNLSCSNNGYWPLSTNSLSWYAYFDFDFLPLTSAATLEPAASSDVTLSSPPPYQAGPFGNFYLPTNTALYAAGSRTPASAGLYHYTTRLDQVKEGNETAGHNVNIGVHYVATAGPGSSQPNDLDGDGILDYVENWHGDGQFHNDGTETDWQHNYSTVGPDGITLVADPSSPVYDDIDLSGNGLVGRVKTALSMTPFDTSNPLSLGQVITGEEPDIATFGVPVNYTLLTAVGAVTLFVDGEDAAFAGCVAAADGNCLLKWNTTYETPGQHYLAAQLNLNDDTGNQSIGWAFGQLAPFYSPNVLQFDEAFGQYDENGAVLYALLPQADASYTIELLDPANPSSPHIRTITGSTSSGEIELPWDLTYDDGTNAFTGSQVQAVFAVNLLDDPASGTSTQILNRATVRVPDGTFDVAFAWEYDDVAQPYYGAMWNTMQYAVVNTLMQPSFAWQAYRSTFNAFTWDLDPGYPGYLPDYNTVHYGLLPDLALPGTRNFYFKGHGSATALGDGKHWLPSPPAARFLLADIRGILGNTYDPLEGIQLSHPYRFVFLDCCSAGTLGWQHEFGITELRLQSPKDDRLARTGPQAFVGWRSDRPGCGDDASAWEHYGDTLEVFFSAWMLGHPLADCVSLASDRNTTDPISGRQLCKPFPVPKNKDLWGGNSSKLKIGGYRGITEGSYVPGY